MAHHGALRNPNFWLRCEARPPELVPVSWNPSFDSAHPRAACAPPVACGAPVPADGPLGASEDASATRGELDAATFAAAWPGVVTWARSGPMSCFGAGP